MENAPGIYTNVPFREYLATPAVNSRLIQTVVGRCPHAAYWESWLNPQRPPSESSGVMDAGTIAHAILLEGGSSRIIIIDPQDYPAEKTGNIPDGWTNKAIRAARDKAYADGNIPILLPAFAKVEAMVETAREFIATLEQSEPAIYRAFADKGGESELTLLWDDDGVLCRARPDRINRERTLIVDYKTGDTSAEPNTWGKTQMVRMGYYIGAAFYRRGVAALSAVKNCAYVFLVQEQDAPYLCSLVGVDERGFDLGNEKIEWGLNLWRKCVKLANFPRYPSRVLYPEIPNWEVAQWEEFESLGIPYDPSLLWEKAPAGSFPA